MLCLLIKKSSFHFSLPPLLTKLRGEGGDRAREIISRAWELFDETERLAIGRPEILIDRVYLIREQSGISSLREDKAGGIFMPGCIKKLRAT